VLLAVVKEGTFPDPLAPRPMAVLSFVQVNVVPETGPDNVVSGAVIPVQYAWFEIGFTVAVE
jgi:hypothetical protein